MRVVVNGIDLGEAVSVVVQTTPVIDPDTGQEPRRRVRIDAVLLPDVPPAPGVPGE